VEANYCLDHRPRGHHISVLCVSLQHHRRCHAVAADNDDDDDDIINTMMKYI